MSTSDRTGAQLLQLALLGHPVAHSRSAQLFAAQAANGGVPVHYELIDTPPSALPATLDRLRAGEWHGVNVTVPHKAAVAATCDRLDAVARASGAVNVVRREADGSLSGFNTDGAGFLAALERHLPGTFRALQPRASVLVLGDGGAARGVCAALMPLHVQITLLSRHPARTATQFVPAFASLCREYSDAQIEAEVARSVLIVQATSLGMPPHQDEAAPIPWQAVGPDQSVVDLIYNPWTTPFLRQAQARGALTLNGWPMLVHQAALALEIWAGPGSGSRLIAAAELVEPRRPGL